jgi:hypothetical protein
LTESILNGPRWTGSTNLVFTSVADPDPFVSIYFSGYESEIFVVKTDLSDLLPSNIRRYTDMYCKSTREQLNTTPTRYSYSYEDSYTYEPRLYYEVYSHTYDYSSTYEVHYIHTDKLQLHSCMVRLYIRGTTTPSLNSVHK